jgi:hypothetical protein
MSCPTCGCTRHAVAQSWQVTCAVCGQERWPTAVARPAAYVCVGCQATPPAVRASRAVAAQKRALGRSRGPAPAG